MSGPLITRIHSHERADELGVSRFSEAMSMKLEKKRQDGRGGWNYPDEVSIKTLRRMLKEHIDKGDMVDVGNIVMMIWNRQNPTGVKK